MINEASSSKLVEVIGTRITTGQMPPGMKLTEAALAKQLGVSRAPLREALVKLEERQLIERVPYSGMRVATLSSKAVAELFEVRSVLEGLACAKAAAVITDLEAAKLRQILRERRHISFEDMDSRKLSAIGSFHAEIAKIAGNEELRRLLGREVWQFLRVNYQIYSRSSTRLEEAAQEHLRILEALEYRDTALAELLMRRHVAKAYDGMMVAASA